MRKKFFLIAAALVAGCSGFDTKPSEQAVVDFHRQLDAGKFDAIWQDSSAAMKKSGTQQDFSKLLGAVHRKLGNVKSAARTDWRVNATTSGIFTTLIYATIYDHGPATETFTYCNIDGKPVLNGFNISSAALIIG